MKNGIHYIEVDAKNGNVINEKKEVLTDKGYKKISKEAFIGREYCITDNKQILPLYGITFKRIDFCVIWRDTNFKDSFWAKSLEKNKKIINKMTGYNLYTEDNTKEINETDDINAVDTSYTAKRGVLVYGQGTSSMEYPASFIN